jgi:hypothetical protein
MHISRKCNPQTKQKTILDKSTFLQIMSSQVRLFLFRKNILRQKRTRLAKKEVNTIWTERITYIETLRFPSGFLVVAVFFFAKTFFYSE